MKKKCSLSLTNKVLSQLSDAGVLIRREIHTGKRKPRGDGDTQKENGHEHGGRQTGREQQQGPTSLESITGNQKRQRRTLPYRFQREITALGHPDCRPQTPELWDHTVLVLQATQIVVLCYSHPRKLTGDFF